MTYDIDTYTLRYDIFLAESELFDELTHYKQILTESGDNVQGLYLLTEGVKETIINYLGKIIKGVQRVWDAIKDRFLNMELPDNIYLKAIEKKIAEADYEAKFTIKNHKKYDDTKFSMIGIIPLEYEQMKPSLNSVENFLKTNYSNIFSTYNQDGTFNVKDAIYQFVVDNVGDTRPTTDMIKQYYKWCTNDYKNSMQVVERDLKLINAVSANVENYVKSTLAQETVDMLNYITEAENDDNEKMKIEDDPDKKEQDTTNSQYVKDLQVYMSATTQILTAKLEILRNRKKDYVSILKHYIPMVKKPKEEENQGNVEVNVQTTTKQVDI